MKIQENLINLDKFVQKHMRHSSHQGVTLVKKGNLNDTRCFKTKYTPHVRQRASAAAAILSRFEAAEENFLE